MMAQQVLFKLNHLHRTFIITTHAANDNYEYVPYWVIEFL
jgi:hypothetical protein